MKIMEFTNEIFFNKKLTADETAIITYCGKLYSEHSEHVSIVYGYGDNWYETTEAPMKEIENGFEVTLEIKNYDTFNFCFKNNFNIWDNNFGFNYISAISPKEIPAETENLDSASTQLEDNTNQTIEVTPQEEISTTEVIETNTEDTNTENTLTEITSQEENSDTQIESLFASLIDSILNESEKTTEEINVDELEGYGLQAVDEIKEENFVNPDDIFKDFYEELASIPTPETTNLITKAQLDDLFETTFQSENKIDVAPFDEVNYENCNQEELDNLMDNILDSITTETTSSNVQTIETQETTSDVSNQDVLDAKEIVSGLPALKSTNGDWFENLVDNTYKFIQKFGTACKKIGTLLKLKAQEYGIIKEK